MFRNNITCIKNFLMNVSDIAHLKGFRPQKTPLADISHITIETNQTCNLRCRTCYNIYQDSIKSLEEIKKEIDFAMTRRRLETITLIGGEPTLHPGMVEVIKYIKGKKLVCQLLTNGVRFRKEPDLVEECKKAGLDRILLHVDSGQPYSAKEASEVIEDSFRLFEKNRIYFALSVTIYNDNSGMIQGIMRSYARYRFFDGILATIERKTPEILFESAKDSEKDRLKHEYESLKSGLGVDPVKYLPSNNSDDEISWLVYFYYINSVTGKCMEVSRRINRTFRILYNLLRRKEFFAVTVPHALYTMNLFISLVSEFLFNPLKSVEIRRLMRGAGGLSGLRYHYIVIQDGPYFDKKRNALRMCYHCPDATIRNSMITPVCMADIINPLNRSIPPDANSMKVYKEVYSHLEQIHK
jgi:hypothetical protein